MRLSSLDHNLARKMQRASASRRKMATIAACKISVGQLKPKEPLVQEVIDALEAGRQISKNDVSALEIKMNELDEVYGDLYLADHLDAARGAFYMARLYAAVWYACRAGVENAADCIYEAAACAGDEVLDAAAECL